MANGIKIRYEKLPKAKCKKLSEDREEMIRMLLALVVMAIIVWIMLISSSVLESPP